MTVSITGITGSQATADNVRVHPFATAVLADSTGQTDTLTITLSAAANGTLLDSHPSMYPSTFVNGVYTLTGSAAVLTAALEALVFTPTWHQVPIGGTVTTGYTLTFASSAPGSTPLTDATASVTATSVVGESDTSHDFAVSGTHDQYTIVSNGFNFVQDNVAGRDGTQTLFYLNHVYFTDGVGVIDSTGNASVIARLYEAAFSRAPDTAGLDLFAGQVNAGGNTISALAATFATSPEFIRAYGTLDNTSFVNQLYNNVLQRAPDQAGAQLFIDQLNSGGNRGDVLLSLANSAENRIRTQPVAGDKNDAESARLYQAALGRTPDEAGVLLYSNALSSGVSAHDIAQSFIGSAEFSQKYGALDNTGFATQLYANVLHRAPEAAGLQNFVHALGSGVDRATILLGFSDSTENRLATGALTHDSWVFTQ